MPEYNSLYVQRQLIEQLALMLGVEEKEIGPETLLRELGVDSLMLVELFVYIEKNFEMDLMRAYITKEDLSTVRNLSKRIIAGI